MIFCEMVKMDALIRNDQTTFRMLDYEPSMHPIGGQICGSKPEIAGVCAKIIEDLGFDVVDLNCGCPVDKVTKDGSGSGMLKTLDLLGEVLSNMVAAVKIPVTVKIRAGWDAAHIVGPQITQIAEEAGASAICVHGRTRAQGYKGPANWDFIRECKMAAKRIPVIGNGDAFDAPSARKLFEYTGCDAILLARGTMGKPWLVDDIYRHFSDQPPIERTGLEYRDIFLEHLDHILSYQSERRALLDFRRVGCWFLRAAPGMRHLRESINRSTSAIEIREMICNYPWHEAEFYGEQKEEEGCEIC
jgi:nifR3 family TIM-barrel protein